MIVRTLTKKQLEAKLKSDPNAYVAVIEVTAVRVDTFLSTKRAGTQLPVASIDDAKFVLGMIAKGLLKSPAALLSWLNKKQYKITVRQSD